MLIPLLAILLFLGGKVVRPVMSVPYLGQACLWSPYFALGYLVHRTQAALPSIWSQLRNGLLLRLAAALLLLASLAVGFLGHSSGFAGLLASSVSVLAAYALAPDRRIPAVEAVSRDSMGLYLFHSPLLYISFAFWPDISPVVMVLVNFVCFGIVAATVTEVVRRAGFGFALGE